jgi:hypothetical protein
MRLASKIFLPVAGGLLVVTAIAVGLGILFVQSLQNHLLHEQAQRDMATIRLLMHQATQEARDLTSLFLRLPEVENAYRLALSGTIDDEADPKVHEARLQLRRTLEPMLAGYAAATGTKLKLHFHLPNSRSLVRLWRKTNFERGGVPLDISDDISPFRQTVVEANSKRHPQHGLEVGVGGFDLRYVLPVTAADGTHLGSAEVLMDLGELLDAASASLQVDAAIFMDDRLLPIAVKLQDAAKHPRMGRFVQVRAPHDPKTAGAVDATWLAQTMQQPQTRHQEDRFLAAFPLQDFSGALVGVLVLSHDTHLLSALLQRAGLIASAVAAVFLGMILLVISLTVRQVVLLPLGRLTQAALRIRDGHLETEI